jgi:hypothetical protein
MHSSATSAAVETNVSKTWFRATSATELSTDKRLRPPRTGVGIRALRYAWNTRKVSQSDEVFIQRLMYWDVSARICPMGRYRLLYRQWMDHYRWNSCSRLTTCHVCHLQIIFLAHKMRNKMQGSDRTFYYEFAAFEWRVTANNLRHNESATNNIPNTRCGRNHSSAMFTLHIRREDSTRTYLQ